jgi:hypothetical protein
MNDPLEHRLREIADGLDRAADRYITAHVRLPSRPNRSRRVAIIGASLLGVASIAVALTVFFTNGTNRNLAPSSPATATPTTAMGSTGASAAPVTNGPETTTIRRPTLDPAHTPVLDPNGNQVGWEDITDPADRIEIPLPESYTSQNPLNPFAIFVQIVRDDAGTAIGLITNSGFIRGGLLDPTHIDPAIAQRLIDDQVAGPPAYTTSPAMSTGASQG